MITLTEQITNELKITNPGSFMFITGLFLKLLRREKFNYKLKRQ